MRGSFSLMKNKIKMTEAAKVGNGKIQAGGCQGALEGPGAIGCLDPSQIGTSGSCGAIRNPVPTHWSPPVARWLHYSTSVAAPLLLLYHLIRVHLCHVKGGN